jgi:hypothetical protein
MLQRLLSRWVFKIDIETCEQCGGVVKVIASIEDPVVIEKILTHLDLNTAAVQAPLSTACLPVQLTRQNPDCRQLAATHGTRRGVAWPAG